MQLQSKGVAIIALVALSIVIGIFFGGDDVENPWVRKVAMSVIVLAGITIFTILFTFAQRGEEEAVERTVHPIADSQVEEGWRETPPTTTPAPTLAPTPVLISVSSRFGFLPETVLIDEMPISDRQRENIGEVFLAFLEREEGNTIIASAWIGVFGEKSSFDSNAKNGGAFQLTGAVYDAHVAEYGEDWSTEAQVDTIWRIANDDDFCRSHNITPPDALRDEVQKIHTDYQEARRALLDLLGEAGKELKEKGSTRLPVDPEASADYDSKKAQSELDEVHDIAEAIATHISGVSRRTSRAGSWAWQIYGQIDTDYFAP
ncbi:MAG: hypothetical protein LBE03_00500 [Candidatus Nomurabacteria bacterium]|jgi:hypothetical protein|nr:hypothetical protein [Candidatus Nomurabacteria bacterium]